MPSPLAGVWELVSEEEDGLLIVTETHFADVTVRKDRTSWPSPLNPDTVTDEMRLDAWQGLLFAISGTYELVSAEGNEYEFLFHPVARKAPTPLNDFTLHPTIDGDTMSDDVGPRHEVWRRIAAV